MTLTHGYTVQFRIIRFVVVLVKCLFRDADRSPDGGFEVGVTRLSCQCLIDMIHSRNDRGKVGRRP